MRFALVTDSTDANVSSVTLSVVRPELFDETKSEVVVETDASTVILPTTFAVTVTVTVALAPAASVPIEQVNVPLHVPWVEDADASESASGSVLETVTPVAVAVLLRFLATNVSVTRSPAFRFSDDGVWVRLRSADPDVVVKDTSLPFWEP